MEKIVIIGFGGHAKSVIDTLEAQNKFQIVGFTDIIEKPSYNGYEYLGKDDALLSLFNSGVKNAHIAVGFLGVGNDRDRIFDYVKEIGFRLPAIIDPSAVVSRRCEIMEGTFIAKKTVINREARIGRMCIINTGSIVEHDCSVGHFSHIADGSILCGNVTVQDHCFVGARTTIIQGVRVGRESILGCGSTVLKDLPDLTIGRFSV